MKKLFLLFLCVVILAGAAACSRINIVHPDRSTVDRVASEIADFELPAGFEADFSIFLLGYKLAAYQSADNRGHLYLLETSNEAVADKVGQSLKQMVPGRYDSNTRLTVVETRPVLIGGQQGKLIISEGMNSEGRAYRQVLATFEGKGGPALLLFVDGLERWDEARLYAMLSSVR